MKIENHNGHAQEVAVSITARQRTDALPPPPPEVLCQKLGLKGLTIEWLAGDGSDRCYYRLQSPELNHSLVLMQLSQSDAEKLKNNGYEWIQIGQLLASEGIFVPNTVATLPEYAALIIEDYGNLMMETQIKAWVNEGRQDLVRKLYRRASYIVIQMFRIKAQPSAVWCQRQFDQDRFVWEMNFFAKHYLQNALNLSLPSAEAKQFKKDIKSLSQFLVDGPSVFVHRDYHSRNLMLRDDRLAILDFQDARLGPVSYDLVSLIFDSYVPLGNDCRMEILQDVLDILENEFPKFYEDVKLRWRAMLLQRQLKAIGSFGYLSIEKGRAQYLDYVPKALMTLEKDWIYDERWPFISKDLLTIMQS